MLHNFEPVFRPVHRCYTKMHSFLANQNQVIFVCILLNEITTIFGNKFMRTASVVLHVLRPRILAIYKNHPVGNFMRRHFLTEPGFTEEGKGSKLTQIQWKYGKESKTFISPTIIYKP